MSRPARLVESSRSDLLLAAIGLPLVAAAAAGAALSVPMHYALGVASLPAGGGVWYALFGDPPVAGSE